MKILAIEHDTPAAAPEAFTDELKQAEARKVWELHQADILREIYFRADQSAAVLMLECATLDDARDVLNSLPLVRAGFITFELIPLRAYPGFSRLFAAECR